jgi:hypothetical protein
VTPQRPVVQELLWPLAPGAVLLGSGALVVYALRGPLVDLPASPAAAVAIVLGSFALGHISRLIAAATAWGVDAIWAWDLFSERAAHELVDELAERRLSADLRKRIGDALEASFGMALPSIGRTDDEGLRDEKARRLEELLALARARAATDGTTAGVLVALESRAEGARALAAALGAACGLVLGTAIHDMLFGRAVAHAFSSFSLVALGLVLLFTTLAALGRARSNGRRLALETLLLFLSVSASGSAKGT